MGRPKGYTSMLEQWSARDEWVRRAGEHDQVELQAQLAAQGPLRERARVSLGEAAEEAVAAALGILRSTAKLPILDRHGKVVGEKPLVAPSTRLQACQWLLATVGIAPVKRLELDIVKPVSLSVQADTLLSGASEAQLSELARLLAAVESGRGEPPGQ